VPEEIRADWGKFLTAAVMGDVWSRPGLDMKSRSMITVAALTALHRPEELRAHLHGALNLGISRQQICEIIMHMAIYGGFPVALEGLRIACEVFEKVDSEAASGPGRSRKQLRQRRPASSRPSQR
jgi:4-carboxymuconolactone decarboxylase